MHLLILAQDEAASGGNALVTFLPLIAIAAFVYFVMIRPQRKRQQEFQAMQSDLQVGDTVHTVGGLVGVVDAITDDFVDLFVTAEADFALRFKRSAIGEIIRDDAGSSDDAADDAEDQVSHEAEDEAAS